jgi:hypothetical protein
MLTQDGPQFPNWDQDATAVADRYQEQDPAVVARELATAAGVIAAHFDRLALGEWQRTGSRSDGAHFTVESFARYFIHDPVHHLWDVTKRPIHHLALIHYTQQMKSLRMAVAKRLCGPAARHRRRVIYG